MSHLKSNEKDRLYFDCKSAPEVAAFLFSSLMFVELDWRLTLFDLLNVAWAASFVALISS